MLDCSSAVLALALLVAAQSTEEPANPSQSEGPEEAPAYTETVVVSVSKLREQLVNAPASVTVLPARVIETSPAQNYGDLLRAVPGVNVIQLSARDVNLASRASTGTIVTSQLALVDGRTVYQDFFGFVLWDLIPINTFEIHQIEVIRGPVSAVWGANAMTGVVNFITKSPREMPGTSVTIGYGGFDRSVGDEHRDSGTSLRLDVTHGEVVNDRVAFKVSSSIFSQSALARPTGNIQNEQGTPYPPFPNQGTRQPKLDFRLDYDFPESRGDRLTVSGGLAATDGIIHTGIGPFDVQRGTYVGYGRGTYRRGAFEVGFFVNALKGGAPTLLTLDVGGEPLIFRFDTKTFDVEARDSRVLGGKHLLSYGGNFRHSAFDLSLATRGDQRDEGGVYVQDEIFLSERFRWIVGGRVDYFDVLGGAVFSPRTAFLFKPGPAHTLRVSFNRAFRAPSFVNSYLDTSIQSQIDLGVADPELEGEIFLFPVAAVGSERLEEESLTGYELGYTGALSNGVVLGAAFYLHDTRNIILFTQTGTYDSSEPPPGWELDPEVLDRLQAEGKGLPSELGYRNFERVRDMGVELSLSVPVNPHLDVFANYTWQREHEPFGFDLSELNLNPRNLVNAGFDFSSGRFFGSLSGSFVDDAFWQDVLDARFHGPTDAYTLVNGTFGIRWEEGRLTTAVKVTNILNQNVQQHVFGDIIKRQIMGELRFHF